MYKNLKSLLTWSAWCAVAAIVIGSIIYSAWAFIALVLVSVLMLGAEDYRLNEPKLAAVK